MKNTQTPPGYISAAAYVFENCPDNRRLESMLIVLESNGQELERSTKRFREANDRLALFLGERVLGAQRSAA